MTASGGSAAVAREGTERLELSDAVRAPEEVTKLEFTHRSSMTGQRGGPSGATVRRCPGTCLVVGERENGLGEGL